MDTYYCGNCSATRPRDEFVRRPLHHAPQGKRFLQCWDVKGCEARASARAVLYKFRVDGYAAKTPAGMVLLALLREARAPLDCVFTERLIRLMLPDVDDRIIASDVAYARTTGLVVECVGTWRLAEGERVDALLASMPEDGPHAKAVRAALLVAPTPSNG